MQQIGIIFSIIAVALLAGILFFINFSTDSATYRTYTNDRYGYTIDYPTSFDPQDGSQNDDGQTFAHDDATLRVLGIQNTDNTPLRALADQYLTTNQGLDVVEDADSHVQLAGSTDANTEVVKVITLSHGRAAVAILQYETEKLPNEVVDHIFTSFTQTHTGNTDNDSTFVPSDYRRYTNDELQFSLLVPAEVTTSAVTDNRVQFKYLGPNNEPATEITDGFTITVMEDSVGDQHKNLREYAEFARAGDAQGNQTEPTTLEAHSLNDNDSYGYSYENQLGNEVTTHIFLPNDGDVGYRVTYSIIDSDETNYQNVVNTILQSLSFIDSTVSSSSTYQSVKLALLDYPAVGDNYTEESTGSEHGCDRVVMVEQDIEPTTTPLTAALTALFAIDTEEYEGWQNFIAQTNDTLSFDRATVTDSVAHIYLAGELSGLAGACDNPRAAIQIEETALQFDTVDSVQLYLNDEPSDDLGAAASGA